MAPMALKFGKVVAVSLMLHHFTAAVTHGHVIVFTRFPANFLQGKSVEKLALLPLPFLCPMVILFLCVDKELCLNQQTVLDEANLLFPYI